MIDRRRPRAPERGNSLLLALIVLSSLATLGSLTVVSVQSSLKASTNDRSHTVAVYAAESGGAAAMQFLRDLTHFDPALGWSAYVLPNGAPRALTATELPSNNAQPGDPNNVFSPDQNAWFSVEIVNNRNDVAGYAAGAGSNDQDGIVIIRSTGHGPQGSLAVIEWEVQRIAPAAPPLPTPPLPVPPDPPPPPPPPAAWPSMMPALAQALHIRSWHIVL